MAEGNNRTAIVIGGGVIGITSAYTLARDGWHVRIIEAREAPARGTSFGNGRQLSYGYASALGSPALLRKLPALLLGSGDAFRMSLQGHEGYYRWLGRFALQCSPAAQRRNTLALIELAQTSRQSMQKLLARHEIEFGHERAGKLVILPDAGAVEAARPMIAAKQAAGLDQRLISAAEALEIEPALAQASESFAGAVHDAHDDTGDCAHFCKGLLAQLRREYGVQFQANTPVACIASEQGRARVTLQTGEVLESDLAVVATGPQARELLSPMGIRIPVQAMKGYSFTAPLGNAAPRVAISDLGRRLVFTHCGDRMLVAGIAEMGRVDGKVDPQRLAAMVASARAALPEAAVYDEADKGWAGLRPMTPNSQPITRMVAPAIAVNAGHGMLGWTLAMGSAERLSALARETA